jgi:hypothetical protein
MNYFGFWRNFISSWIRIRIWNADPDPGDKFNADPCGSGSETLLETWRKLAEVIAKVCENASLAQVLANYSGS